MLGEVRPASQVEDQVQKPDPLWTAGGVFVCAFVLGLAHREPAWKLMLPGLLVFLYAKRCPPPEGIRSRNRLPPPAPTQSKTGLSAKSSESEFSSWKRGLWISLSPYEGGVQRAGARNAVAFSRANHNPLSSLAPVIVRRSPRAGKFSQMIPPLFP